MYERPADWLDMGADLAERERAAVLAGHAERRAREAAAAAAAAGRTDAQCDDCGAQIEPRRLAAMPHATRCVPCQSVAARQAGRHA